MDKVKSTIPLDQIEQAALDQIISIASMEPVIQIAIMPDVHAGYTMPIGGVALVEGHISPEFVGYDIGCGMCSCNFGQLPSVDWQKVYDQILQKIPVGIGRHNTSEQIPIPLFALKGMDDLAERYTQSFHSLGSGNHFIEIGINAQNEYAVTIHSGSRGFGHSIGTYYMKQAKEFRYGLIPQQSYLFEAYLHDMNIALDLALKNRLQMIHTIAEILNGLGCQADPSGIINENHNHAIITPQGVLHRKGATPADKGQLGIIPINQKDGTYITKGLGNADFLFSASHGAGRIMSRKKARRLISLEKFQHQMSGIICRTDMEMLDEAPDAYKAAKSIISIQDGLLIEIVDHFKPVLVVKG